MQYRTRQALMTSKHVPRVCSVSQYINSPAMQQIRVRVEARPLPVQIARPPDAAVTQAVAKSACRTLS